jgi:hypothetical protein
MKSGESSATPARTCDGNLKEALAAVHALHARYECVPPTRRRFLLRSLATALCDQLNESAALAALTYDPLRARFLDAGLESTGLCDISKPQRACKNIQFVPKQQLV